MRGCAAAPRAALRAMHLGQEQADAKQRCRCARRAAATVISPPIRSVSILAMVRPRPVPPLAAAPRPSRARRARRCARARRPAMPGPVSSISKTRHLARHSDAEHDAAARGELHRVAQQVDEDLAQALLVGAHHRRQAAPSSSSEARCPWPRACSSNMRTICCRQSRKAQRPGVERAACRPRCGRCRACLRSATAGGRRRAGSRAPPARRCGGIAASSSSSCA